MRSAFTLMELLVVIGIIMALAGISYPVVSSMKAKSDINGSTQLVHAVAAAIESYQLRAVTGKDGRVYRAFTLGQDLTDAADPRHIDGDPRKYATGSLLVTRAPDSYTGFVDMTGFPAPKGSLNAQGQVVDRWRQPLRLVYAAHVYGASDFGVWSTGPDKGAATGSAADDLGSWKGTDE